jgi:hypothetical protein
MNSGSTLRKDISHLRRLSRVPRQRLANRSRSGSHLTSLAGGRLRRDLLTPNSSLSLAEGLLALAAPILVKWEKPPERGVAKLHKLSGSTRTIG